MRPLYHSCDAPHDCLWRLNDANTSRQGHLDHVTACKTTVSTDKGRHRYHLPLRKSSVWTYFFGSTQYVKRIVAVAGDIVRYSACNIFVTTAAGQEVRDTEPTMACRDWGDLKQVVVPDGMYFVAGDNRAIALIREFSAQSANRKSMPRC